MVGEESTASTFQIVQIEPTCKADFPKMQECKEGAEIVLSAKVDGSPPPTAVWLLEGEEIKADGMVTKLSFFSLFVVHCRMRDKRSMFLSTVFKNLIFLCCF